MITADENTATESIQGAAPDLMGISMFPSEDIIRPVILDPVTIPSSEMVPNYFGTFREGDMQFPSAIVVIRTEEKSVLPPSSGKDEWETAIQLWPKNARVLTKTGSRRYLCNRGI